MAYILNIETATRNCSVSISASGEVISLREVAESGYSHAEKLHIFFEEVLLESKITFSELSAIAVSRGPGSYTGLRIGVSAAKGLSYALRIPLISTDTLQALAMQANVSEGLVIPMIDARRMEVYSAIFDTRGNLQREIMAQIIDENSFSDITEKVHIVGDCADKCKPVLTGPNITYLEDIVFPSASSMAQLSFDKFIKSEFEDVAYFEPYYLKDFLIASKKQH